MTLCTWKSQRRNNFEETASYSKTSEENDVAARSFAKVEKDCKKKQKEEVLQKEGKRIVVRGQKRFGFFCLFSVGFCFPSLPPFSQLITLVSVTSCYTSVVLCVVTFQIGEHHPLHQQQPQQIKQSCSRHRSKTAHTHNQSFSTANTSVCSAPTLRMTPQLKQLHSGVHRPLPLQWRRGFVCEMASTLPTNRTQFWTALMSGSLLGSRVDTHWHPPLKCQLCTSRAFIGVAAL